MKGKAYKILNRFMQNLPSGSLGNLQCARLVLKLGRPLDSIDGNIDDPELESKLIAIMRVLQPNTNTSDI